MKQILKIFKLPKDKNKEKLKRYKTTEQNTYINIAIKNLINLDKILLEKINLIQENQGKKSIEILQPDTNIEAIYTYKNKHKNFYFYHCNKRPKCKELRKFIKNRQTFIIIIESYKDNLMHKK